MTKSSTYSMLKELTQKSVDESASQLGHIEQSYQQAKQQLEMLNNYYDEYQARLTQSMNKGIDNTLLQNYQQFISTLEFSIKQQQQTLEHWEQNKQKALESWQLEQRRLNAFSTLYEREEKQRITKENRQEQKHLDEFVQNQIIRKEIR